MACDAAYGLYQIKTKDDIVIDKWTIATIVTSSVAIGCSIFFIGSKLNDAWQE